MSDTTKFKGSFSIDGHISMVLEDDTRLTASSIAGMVDVINEYLKMKADEQESNTSPCLGTAANILLIHIEDHDGKLVREAVVMVCDRHVLTVKSVCEEHGLIRVAYTSALKSEQYHTCVWCDAESASLASLCCGD